MGKGKARVYTNAGNIEMRNHRDHLSNAKAALDTRNVSV